MPAADFGNFLLVLSVWQSLESDGSVVVAWGGYGILLLVIRETNMLCGVLYPVDAIWFGISNRTYTHFVMGAIGLTALNYLIKGKAQRWIPKGKL